MDYLKRQNKLKFNSELEPYEKYTEYKKLHRELHNFSDFPIDQNQKSINITIETRIK